MLATPFPYSAKRNNKHLYSEDYFLYLSVRQLLDRKLYTSIHY